MTTETVGAKPAAKPKSILAALAEGGMRVRTLLFRGGHVPLPFGVGDQQQVMVLSEEPRTGGPKYEITYLPRIDKYLVRARGSAPFWIPGDWATAELFEQ